MSKSIKIVRFVLSGTFIRALLEGVHFAQSNSVINRIIRMAHPVFVKDNQWTTAPFDPRFPNTNQTKNCYQNYLDFHRCKNKRGEEYSACQYFKKVYRDLCPADWISKWDEQIEKGTFPGKI